MKEVAVGIDIGGTNSRIGIVDREGEVYFEENLSTTSFEEIETLVETLLERIQIGLERIEEPIELKGIGIGAPNANFYKGTIENAPNLRWKGVIRFCDMFKKFYPDIPVIITNDANAAAIGEMVYGGAKGMKNFIVITLGTGLGSGIVVNGELVYGHTSFAGELGHVSIVPSGRKCNCGRRGCLETYVSAPGLRRTFYKLLSDHNGNSPLSKTSFDELTAEMIWYAAKENDVVALEAFKQTGKKLGQALVNAIAHTSPEAIFLFGGLARSGELIFKPTRKYIDKNIQTMFEGSVKLLPSQITESTAAILGASALIWKELDK